MTKKQLIRFGALILAEASDLKSEAERQLAAGNPTMSDFYATAAMAVYKTHNAILKLAEETN